MEKNKKKELEKITEELFDNSEFEDLFEDFDLDDDSEEDLFDGFDDDIVSENMDHEEQFVDTASKILNLSDKLSEEIILENIKEQMEDIEKNPFERKINYISLFKDKYRNLDVEDFADEKNAKTETLREVVKTALDGIEKNYLVEIGEDIEFNDMLEYLDKVSSLYEFLYVRHYQNIKDYIFYKIKKMKKDDIEYYERKIDSEPYNKDVFIQQCKKKFKNSKDLIVYNFLDELIDDIRSSADSGYLLFKDIVELDQFETINFDVSEMIDNYGNDIVLNNDLEAAKKYLSLIDVPEVLSQLKNDILMSYMENEMEV